MSLIFDIVLVLVSAWIAWRSPLAGLSFAAQGYVVRNSYVSIFSPSEFFPETPLVGLVQPIVVIIIVAVRLILSKKTHGFHYRWTAIDTFIFGMGVLLWLGSIYSPFPFYGFEITFRYWVLGVLVYYMARFWGASNTERLDVAVEQSILVVYLVGVFISSIMAVRFFQEQPVLEAYDRLSVGDASVISIAYLIAFSFNVNIFYLVTEKRPKWLSAPILSLTAVLLISCLLLTGTRGALVVAVLNFLLCLFFIFRIQKRFIARLRVFGILLPIAAIAVLLFLRIPQIQAPTFYRLDGLMEDKELFEDESTESRLHGQMLARDRFIQSPLLGTGTGVWKDDPDQYPHNIFFEAASQSGVFGIIVLLSLAYGILQAGYAAFRSRSEIYALIFTLVLGAFLQAQFSGSLYMHKSLYFFSALLVLAMPGTRLKRSHLQDQVG